MDNTEEVLNPEKAIEAILFAAGHPVSYSKLSEVIGLGVSDIKKLVKHLAGEFENSGLQLLMFPDTCQISTREEYAPYIREALGIRKGGNLSASTMEVLAIIAYNQPATKSYVEKLRGADSSYAVSSLIDKELIEVAGKLDAPGRPFLYTTTDKFLRVFGLNSISDLPLTNALETLPAQELESADAADGQVSMNDAETAESVESTESENTAEAAEEINKQ